MLENLSIHVLSIWYRISKRTKIEWYICMDFLFHFFSFLKGVAYGFLIYFFGIQMCLPCVYSILLRWGTYTHPVYIVYIRLTCSSSTYFIVSLSFRILKFLARIAYRPIKTATVNRLHVTHNLISNMRRKKKKSEFTGISITSSYIVWLRIDIWQENCKRLENVNRLRHLNLLSENKCKIE